MEITILPNPRHVCFDQTHERRAGNDGERRDNGANELRHGGFSAEGSANAVSGANSRLITK